MYEKSASIIFFISLITCSDSARILAVMPTPSYSHQIVFNPLWITLNAQGHHVTLLSTDPTKNLNLTNFRQVDWGFAYQLWHEKHNVSDIINNFNVNLLKCLLQYVAMMNDIFTQELEHPQVQEIINDPNEHFDLLIVEYLDPAMIAFSKRFRCPFIGVSPMDITNFAHEALGNPVSPALFPDLMAPFDEKMTFFERVINTFYYIGGHLFFKYYFYPETDKIVRKYFGEDTPRLEDLQRNASLIFLNVNPIIHNVRPLMSNVLVIGGGTHIDNKGFMPPDIQFFLDEAKAGAIYFSLGTNVKSKDLSLEIRSIILETFSKLPYKILWKFEDPTILSNKNILVRKWLPQQQILKHENIKLFITQGGLQSLEEAIYNGIPIIALPTYIDQYSNVRRVVRKGMGLTLNREKLTEETLTQAIVEVIKNPKYKNKAVELSTVLKEQPISSLQMTVWWINYVLKHKGAKFLKHSEIPFYQYFLIDVIVFLILVLSISAFFFYTFMKSFFRFIKSCRKGKTVKVE